MTHDCGVFRLAPVVTAVEFFHIRSGEDADKRSAGQKRRVPPARRTGFATLWRNGNAGRGRHTRFTGRVHDAETQHPTKRAGLCESEAESLDVLLRKDVKRQCHGDTVPDSGVEALRTRAAGPVSLAALDRHDCRDHYHSQLAFGGCGPRELPHDR
ncbi:MAG: hypothetical protein IID45_04260 [Planctomycetes bacterium]|nr:hypothetical protein [Planctomycetota bacterium]